MFDEETHCVAYARSDYSKHGRLHYCGQYLTFHQLIECGETQFIEECAQWIVENTPFDRLYFYGDDRPVHISFGPNHDRQVICMKPSKSGRLMPQVVATSKFLKY